MRALALTQTWLDSGGTATWHLGSAPDALAAMIVDEGVSIVRVDAQIGDDADADKLRKALVADTRSVGVVDGLDFDDRYLAMLGEPGRNRVLLIDDMAAQSEYPVALVLNQNAHAVRSAYPADSAARFLLGTGYVMLRREFAADPPPRTAPLRARRVLVTFGGSDPTGMTSKTLRGLRRLPPGMRRAIHVNVIVGAANAGAAEIMALAADAPGLEVTVAATASDMRFQMATSDLAITSGGTTVWELARMGCPAIVVATGPSEVLLTSGLGRLGLFSVLGQEAKVDEAALADALADTIRDQMWREKMSALGMRLVDGRGAERVVGELAGLTWTGM